MAMVPLLSSCSKGGEAGTEAAVETKKVQTDIYQTDLLSVEVPQGWQVLPQADKPDSLYVYKGDKDPFDSPAVIVSYYDPDTEMISPKGIYPEAKDIDPVQIGDYTWEGFTADSSGYPITILTLREPHQFQVQLFNEVSDQKISLADDDVQVIIRSIAVK